MSGAEVGWIADVCQAQRGDRAAFERLVGRFRERVLAAVRKRLAHHQDAEEVTQETFIQAWRELPRLRDPSRFAAWLHRIARTRGSNFRTRWRQETLPLDGVDWSGQSSLGAAGLNGALQPDATRMQEALGTLSDINRLTASLFYVDGFSVQEIAAQLHTPTGTVKRRLHDARVRLKQHYRPEEPPMTRTEPTRAELPRELRVPPALLLAALRRVSAAVADESRPALTSVVMRWSDGGLTLSAADGFRIAEVSLSANDASASPLKPIPAAWEEWRTRVRVPTAGLRDALAAADLPARGGAPLLLDAAGGALRLYAKPTPQTPAYETSLPAEVEGTPQRIALNGDYLAQLLEVATEPEVELTWGDPQKPMIVREIAGSPSAPSADAPTVTAKWAIMPMEAPSVMGHQFAA